MAETIEKREAPVVRRIFGLISERRNTAEGLAEYLEIKRTTVYGWKRRGGFLFKKYIYEICDYLDTTPNYLFLGPEEDKLSPEELKILQRYRRLSSTKKKCIMDELRELVGKKDENELKIRGQVEIDENLLY